MYTSLTFLFCFWMSILMALHEQTFIQLKQARQPNLDLTSIRIRAVTLVWMIKNYI